MLPWDGSFASMRQNKNRERLKQDISSRFVLIFGKAEKTQHFLVKWKYPFFHRCNLLFNWERNWLPVWMVCCAWTSFFSSLTTGWANILRHLRLWRFVKNQFWGRWRSSTFIPELPDIKWEERLLLLLLRTKKVAWLKEDDEQRFWEVSNSYWYWNVRVLFLFYYNTMNLKKTPSPSFHLVYSFVLRGYLLAPSSSLHPK